MRLPEPEAPCEEIVTPWPILDVLWLPPSCRAPGRPPHLAVNLGTGAPHGLVEVRRFRDTSPKTLSF